MKVFLSSTYLDLIEHRKAAHNALEQLGLHVIWMEAFGARPVDSTTACLNEVEESDLFIGIYAYRYGYIPNGKDISITEEEFNYAQKLEKPIFGFVLNNNYDWPFEWIEKDKKVKLDAFLKKLRIQPIELFTTPDNLASSIASSIGHYLIQNNISKAYKNYSISKSQLLQVNPIKLRKAIHKAYNWNEFEVLIKDNGLDSHDLPEGPFENKIMHFIDRFQKRQIYDSLVSQVINDHPELISDLI